MESIGVRELRQHASRWLERVSAGESFTVTDRGRPVATLAPIVGSEWDRLVAAGAVLPAGPGNVWDLEPLPATAAGATLSDLLEEDRSDER